MERKMDKRIKEGWTRAVEQYITHDEYGVVSPSHFWQELTLEDFWKGNGEKKYSSI